MRTMEIEREYNRRIMNKWGATSSNIRKIRKR
jgi:hypothetical protein